MHSRIYQIKTTPVPSNDYISEYDFIDHWFVGSIADYVSDDINREEDIEWLRKSLEKQEIIFFNDDSSFTILPKGKAIYFDTTYQEFRKAIEKASTITLDDFMESKSSEIIYSITSYYSDKFGFYVSLDELGVKPFDEFMRLAIQGQRYYIGGIVDYHC